MSKNIIVLNGAARKNGNTAKLVEAFADGARSAGHQVKVFYLDGMDIHSCKGCLRSGKDPKHPCSQRDDMDLIYAGFADADVVVFASPLYFWTVTGRLKTAADRLYAELECLGCGTYQTSPRITQRCVEDALSVGYRSIDTAQCYGNEREVGLACRNSDIPRNELFITTKLWACHGYQDTLRSIDASLKRLNLDYIDLFLIHEPTGDVHEIYRAMETVYKEGKLKVIGVSNFLEERYLDLVNHCKVVPAVNQVETHVFRQQKKLREPEGLEVGKSLFNWW